MNIENKTIYRINLFGYAFPEFDLLIIPETHNGSPVNNCYLYSSKHARMDFMFSLVESIERAAEIAYANVPDYIGDFFKLLFNEE